MTDAPSLRARIQETLAGVPPEVDAMIDRMVEDLGARRATPGIEVGETAPDFTLPDALGAPVRLADRLAEGPTVVSFYRGAWCPICNLELRALQEVLPALRAAGASLIAVSPHPPDLAAALVDQLELGFTTCSDVDQEVAAAYRVKFTLADELRALYEHFGLVLPEQNADASWDLPVPATFVIDRDGIVRARHVDPDYRTRMEPADIVAAVRALSG